MCATNNVATVSSCQSPLFEFDLRRSDAIQHSVLKSLAAVIKHTKH